METINAEFVDPEPITDTEFAFDLSEEGIALSLSAWGWNFSFQVIWDSLVRFFNLIGGVWNNILAMLTGGAYTRMAF